MSSGLIQIEEPNAGRRAAGAMADLVRRVARLERNRTLTEDKHAIGVAPEPLFQNSWANVFGSTTYYKDAAGRVWLEGILNRGGGNWTATELIFTLPAGYRPQQTCHFICSASNGVAQVIIAADGTVRIGDFGGPTNPVGYLTLNQINFRAA